jgi:hypothetical protein
MTTVSPPITASSSMCAWPGGVNKVLLLATNGYPASDVLQNLSYEFNGSGTPNWVLESPASVMDPGGPLPGRSGSVMSTFDGTNVVLFGGNTQSAKGFLGDTWEWTGSWAQLTPAASPSARSKAGLGYISGTGAVLFGGCNSAETPLGDTWVFSAGNWVQSSFANGASPAARFGHAMASSGSEVLMFGGCLGGELLGFETWSFASNTWTKLAPAAGTSPEARTNAAMVYDGYAGLFVMFGGANSAGVLLEETWTFNTSGNVWTQVPVANGTGPSARVGAQMAFDTVSDRTILFGGVSATTMEPTQDSWSFNAVSGVWTQL